MVTVRGSASRVRRLADGYDWHGELEPLTRFRGKRVQIFLTGPLLQWRIRRSSTDHATCYLTQHEASRGGGRRNPCWVSESFRGPVSTTKRILREGWDGRPVSVHDLGSEKCSVIWSSWLMTIGCHDRTLSGQSILQQVFLTPVPAY
jgi:hypothetical protein